MKQYMEAISINESNADNYFNLANVYQHLKNYAEAHRNFGAAI